jgi:hypothetical protein
MIKYKIILLILAILFIFRIKIVSFICWKIWDFSERLHIPLGKFAPIIFNGMMEQWGKKQ